MFYWTDTICITQMNVNECKFEGMIEADHCVTSAQCAHQTERTTSVYQ